MRRLPETSARAHLQGGQGPGQLEGAQLDEGVLLGGHALP